MTEMKNLSPGSESVSGRCLGLVGGLGVGATVHYYRELAKAHAARGCALNTVILHADLDFLLKLVTVRDIAGMAQYLSHIILRMQAAGAQIAAIPSINPQICAAELARLSPIPLVSPIDATLESIRTRGIRRIALFGTRFAIESKMFGRLAEVEVEVVTPRPAEIEAIHAMYIALATSGNADQAQFQALRGIAHTLVQRDRLDAVILAGTDLTLLFNEANTDFPHIDVARVHLDEIMRQLFAAPADPAHRIN
jgi:aspartate racemase